MIKKRKIYIAGCGGMLGEAFHKIFNEDYELKCTDIDVNEAWLSSLDFRNYEAYWRDVSEFKPDYLFHLGAYTDLEFCELNLDGFGFFVKQLNEASCVFGIDVFAAALSWRQSVALNRC